MVKQGKPHAVFKYYARFLDQRRTMWEMSVNPNRIGWTLTKQEAMKAIEDWGLELAYEDENGAVYDTPDRRYLNLFARDFNELEYGNTINRT